jgi:hypothetical protein
MQNNINIHLFYLRSNFHFEIAKSIIFSKKINNDNCYFVVNRNVNIVGVKKNIIKINDSITYNFFDKIKQLINKKQFPEFFYDSSKVISYLPFFQQIPFNFSGEIVFFEEGLSAYTSNKNQKLIFKIKESLKSICRLIIVNILFPFSKRKIKTFLTGPLYFYFFFSSKNFYNYYTYSKKVNISGYPNIVIKKIKLDYVVKSHKKLIKKENCVIVLDRLTPPLNFNINNYKKILKLIFLDFNEYKNFLIKFHPFDNQNSKKLFFVFLSQFKNCTIIDESLEELASSKNPYTFVGTNSTILYYAPLMGNNKSFSYSKKLIDIDIKYQKFLELWGNDKNFLNFFSSNVTLNV